MAALAVLVDYDNVDRTLSAVGPVNCAKILLQAIPRDVLRGHDSILVRLYGGWRSNGRLTNAAQRIVPDIRAASPTVVSVPGVPTPTAKKLVVELAEAPIGLTTPLDQTLARDRTLRRFRANPSALSGCVNVSNCGMSAHFALSHALACSNSACSGVLGDLLVRDEQKMVDTLIVADLAHQVFVGKASHIAIVSSDTDMWPGVLLALQHACNVHHIHTRNGGRTQRHLLQTLTRQMTGQYAETSV
jgi:hypothetical protein